MDQNQTPWQNQPQTYPPATPQPQQPQPVQPQTPAGVPQYAQQPTAQQYTQPSTSYPQSTPGQQTPPAGSWYTPQEDPNAYKPSDAASYIQSANPSRAAAPQAQSAAPTTQGQMVNGQYSIDYLDTVATPSSPGIDKKMIFIGVGLAVALLLGALMIFMPRKSTVSSTNEADLYTTMVDVEASTTRSKNLIKNSKLSAINSNMRTSLVNAIRDMEKPLTDSGKDPSGLKTSARSGNANDKKFDTALEDARLNGTYDRVYSREVNNKMKLMVIYLTSIEASNKRESTQEFVKKNKQSFETIQKSFDEWIESPDANLY